MKRGKSSTKSIGTRILTIVVIGLIVPIGILIGSYIYSMNKVAGDAQEIVSAKLLTEVQNAMKYTVQTAAASTESLYRENTGKLTDRQLVETALKVVESTKYGEAGYFFVYQQDGIRLVAPENKAQVGKNLWDLTDPNGKKVVQELIGAAKKGGDFVTYIWLNPKTQADEMKISYSAPLRLGDTEYVIGTGTYLPMIEASKAEIRKNIDSTKAEISYLVISISIIISFLVLITIYFFIRRQVVKPVKMLVRISNELASGNLDLEIDAGANDEVGELARSFQKVTDNLNDIMLNIRSAADQVASGSKQISDSSMALSEGATEQASSIEQLTASLEEISEKTRQNADNANQANSLVAVAKAGALQGNDRMKQMLAAMNDINESSANISKIIKVIDEIAFQTNILALNAAVEAARAGQHGKGFAVVAEEVRNLAARSANAAKETTAMIENSIRKSEDGTKVADETAAALNSIVEGVTKVAALVGDIASASNEQASGISQVSHGVSQISDVVQTNSATSQQTAAASEELSGQSEMLKQQVAQFRLK